jgi:hypothetical protein
VYAFIVQKIIERTRAAGDSEVVWFDGIWVWAAACSLGVALAWGTGDGLTLMSELTGEDVNRWLDLVVTGVAIGSGAGFIADISNRNG